jgi:hypothetical protein
MLHPEPPVDKDKALPPALANLISSIRDEWKNSAVAAVFLVFLF